MSFKLLLKLVLPILVIFLTTNLTLAQKVETGFLNRTLTLDKKTYRYQVYVPQNYTKAKKWSVILFLHGRDERGQDGLLQTDVGLASSIRRYVERFPVIVVFPQCPIDSHWTQPEAGKQALKALDKTIGEFNIDLNKVYLTGISMGGAGTWYLAADNPNKFAAIAPVCAWVIPPANISSLPKLPEMVTKIKQEKDPYLAMAKLIGKTPVWLFHGEEDQVVSVSESQKMVEAFKTLELEVKYTEYPNIGHNSWDQAYSESDFLSWLLSYSLNK
ncbi:MAG: prolyl oligopeptidase family serine peptidase [Acidobacteria bacterium]|nr:prolyl oligopeptidase family serine peptidase [Acidobacteriota bacterium]